MENRLYVVEVCKGKEVRRRAKEVTCIDCCQKWLIRADRKSPLYCKSCSVKGERNAMYSKDSWNKGLAAFDKKKFNRNYVNQARWDMKKALVRHMGNKCVMCHQENLPICVWQWHHIDPEQKVKALSQMLIGSREALYEEAKKCVLICSNCHKIYHYGNETLEHA